jgi:Anti-sigma-K factor rskA
LNNKEYISSGIVEQYVLGLSTQEEQGELDMLRKQDPLVEEAILQFEIELEEKMMRHSFLPGVATDDKILQTLQSFEPSASAPILQEAITPVVPFTTEVPKKVVKFSFAKIAAAAAILLFGISAFYNYTQFKENKNQAALLAATKNLPASLPAANYEVLKNPSITPVAMMGQGYHTICRCTMFWDKSTGKAYVMIHHLVSSGDNHEYQLWATVNGKQVSVGMINDTIRDRFVEVTGVPQDANEFIVTLENNGGGTVPDADVFLKGTI